MLWGVTVRCPHASARILSHRPRRPRRSAPGVAAVLTAADVPGREDVRPRVLRPAGARRTTWSATSARRSRSSRPRRPSRRAPRRRRSSSTTSRCPSSPTWSRRSAPTRRACTTSATSSATSTSSTATLDAVEADVWVEGYYETAMQDQAALGPEGGLAVPAADGGIDLYAVTQWLHVDRQQIAPCLDLPEEKVRITLAGVGGAFGSREDIHMQIHACLLALRTRPAGEDVVRPRGVVPRPRAPASVAHLDPLRRDAGRPARRRRRAAAARRRRVRVVLARRDRRTPRPSPPARTRCRTCASRAPSSTRTTRRAARCAGSARRRSASRTSRRWTSSPASSASTRSSCGCATSLHTGSVLPTGQVLDGQRARARGDRALRARSRCPSRSRELGRDPIAYPGGAGNVSRGESLKRGVGFALGFKNVAYSEGFDDAAEATVTLRPGPDGPVAVVHTAAVDYGQGLYTVLAQIVRTELGVDEVVFEPASDRGRLGRIDVGVAPDDDDRRRGARRLPRGARRARRGAASTSRSRARARTTTAPTDRHRRRAARATSTSASRSRRSAPSSRSTRSSASCASSRSRRRRTPAAS